MYRFARSALADNIRLLVFALAAFVVLWNLLLRHDSSVSLSNGVVWWWAFLCAVAVVNVCGWYLAASGLAYRKVDDLSVHRLRRWHLLLSAVYVFGCGFRAILPRADVQRLGLFDSWVSSVLVGRSVATVAELCFVAQWALLLNQVGRAARAPGAMLVARALVPLIVLAEVCSWYSVLTTSYLGNALEESLWALSAALLTASCLGLLPWCSRACRPLVAAATLLGVCYVLFMCTVDVPMYVSRWQADEASGRQYLSLALGLQDVWSRRVVTYAWDEWRTEIPWMSLYFSIGVWCSIACIHAPAWIARRWALPAEVWTEQSPTLSAGH
jgi:hypothetical protein